jgi:hypothetical protein
VATATAAASSAPPSAVTGTLGAMATAAAPNLLRVFSAKADGPDGCSPRVEPEGRKHISSISRIPQVFEYDEFPPLQDSILVSSVITNKFQTYLQGSAPRIKTPCGGLNLLAKNFSPSPVQYSYEDIVAYGGIPENSTSGIRNSGRLQAQPNADQSQMERAMLLTQRHQTPGSTSDPKLSILEIPDNTIIHRASRLGVSLGKSPEHALVSVRNIKALEKQRDLVILDKKNSVEEDNPHSLLVSKLSGLCEDLTEENTIDMDNGHTDQKCHASSVLPKKGVAKRGTRATKKVVVEKLAVRRSSRIRKIRTFDS